jgi:hypothetical protein
MTAIGSVSNVLERGSAPIEEACDGSIPLSPLAELEATIGAAEFGTAVEDSGLETCATNIDGAAPGDAGAVGVGGTMRVFEAATGETANIKSPNAPVAAIISLRQ